MSLDTEAPAPPPVRAPVPEAEDRALRKRERAFAHRDKWWGYAFIAPAGLGLAVFYLWPVVQTLYYSFTEWGAFGGTTWIGTANYDTLLHDAEFWQALGNTLLYTGLVLLGIPLAMVLAVLLNLKGMRGTGVYRTLYFLPVVTMPAAVAVVWRWLYSGDVGILNQALDAVGINGTYWVSDPDTVRFAVAAVGVWMTVGYNMILLLAGLQGIPQDYYEAASLDGAGRVRQFFSVTMPLLSPTLFFTTVLSVIQSLQVFDLIYLILGANTSVGVTNPAYGEGQTVVMLFFQKSFFDNQRGYGAAIVSVLFVLIMALTALQFRLQKKWVHYA
ncbi:MULTISPECIES: carbohydrate ABC transporter permease [Streptomyces]|uniref:Binding-protein-dependent transporter inner membrane component n=1 Tax=Streptomyces albus (strain ATCC 21838 / DSM 41398 / FERM P-419 / JCM 4703 / NBRC 107858) TaxID=1081613 RepID=A0A0B5EXR5_STRA4|nr:sugar ABC transporter permease [Streptomyces sp. SCSIO ZS0520]AJE87603.1 binding-protein-dependent transporter inner membrane component [Streptomyces albus]AOU81904.1 binding-protein-dependent transporter inner membrane component [Streptomyces albus]AYN37588.1 sugar ABC transporter permease [Streptomyces albus]